MEKAVDNVSWYQSTPEIQAELLQRVPITMENAHVIDVGAGASVFVDHLLTQHWKRISVLDISASAIQKAKERLGLNAEKVNWVVGDVTKYPTTDSAEIDVWVDRACFHFLVDQADRDNYKKWMLNATKEGSYILMGTFDLEGPTKCSGLPIQQYSAESLTEELGSSNVKLLYTTTHVHETPWNSSQVFRFCLFQRLSLPE